MNQSPVVGNIPINNQQHNLHPLPPIMQMHNGSLPQQQPIPQQIVTQQQNTATNAPANDNIVRVRSLVLSLKESLSNLMKLGASNIGHNSQIDSGSKSNMENLARFDKSWEEFNSVCNQIELHLKTVQECAIQYKDSKTYMPFNVSSISKNEPHSITGGESSISYAQYVHTIKNQISYAKTIQEILTEGAKKISQLETPNLNQQNYQQQNNPQTQQNINNQQLHQNLSGQQMQQTQSNLNSQQMQPLIQQPNQQFHSSQQIITPQSNIQNQINSQQINLQQQLNPQQLNPQQINQHQLNQQQINQQPMNPQQINNQQINSQMIPQQQIINQPQMISQQINHNQIPQQQMMMNQQMSQQLGPIQQQMGMQQQQMPPQQQMMTQHNQM